MIEFNHTLLADLIFQGYRYFVFYRKESQIAVVPLKTPVPQEQLSFLGYAQLDLKDLKTLEIINSIDLFSEFPIFINQKYFDHSIVEVK
ncbi:MAG: hypothetical protein JSS79_00920 [Bacteroidetes bacterium]|nr:hypothetical protein [Bacteroidota bacterium]